MITTQAAETWIVKVPRETIEHPTDANRAILENIFGGIIASCVKEGRLRKITLTITGYGSDPRELYEIPEICTWASDTFKFLPSLWFFLDDDSQDRFVGWLCGPVAQQDIQLPDFLYRLNHKRMECATASTAASSDFLERAAASKETVSTFYLQQLNKRANTTDRRKDGFAGDRVRLSLTEITAQFEPMTITLEN